MLFIVECARTTTGTLLQPPPPKYAECMMILIEEFLQKELGDIKGELPFMIMDNIYLNKSN